MGNGDHKSGGFEIDVEMMEKQVKNRLVPAVDHFQKCATSLESLESNSMSSATSGEGRGGVSSYFVTAFDSQIADLVSQRDKAVQTLAGFVDALKAVISYYKTKENENVHTIHSLGGNI